MSKRDDADWMRHLLNVDGLTQAEGAELIGISPRMMRYYVSGEREVPPSVLLAMEFVILFPEHAHRERPPKREWYLK